MIEWLSLKNEPGEDLSSSSDVLLLTILRGLRDPRGCSAFSVCGLFSFDPLASCTMPCPLDFGVPGREISDISVCKSAALRASWLFLSEAIADGVGVVTAEDTTSSYDPTEGAREWKVVSWI